MKGFLLTSVTAGTFSLVCGVLGSRFTSTNATVATFRTVDFVAQIRIVRVSFEQISFRRITYRTLHTSKNLCLSELNAFMWSVFLVK